MRLMPVKEKRRFYPPFKNDLADILDWLKPINVVVKGEFLSGGVIVSPTIVAVTGAMDAEKSVILLPNGKKVKGELLDYHPEDFFLTFYRIEETEWVGLPAWDGDVDKDTMFFSFIPIRRERVVMWNPIVNTESESYQKTSKTKRTALSVENFEHTFPVVDQFGYFVGLSIGTSEGECLTQIFTLKTTKL